MLSAVLRSLAAAVFVLFLTAAAHGQRESRADAQPAGQIQGQVRLADGNQPVFNAIISCDDFRGGFIGQEKTDRNGRFSFRNLGLSQYNVRVHMPGYADQQETVDLMTASNAYVQFQLRPEKSGERVPAPAGVGVDASVPPAAQKEFEDGRAALLAEAKQQNVEQGIRHLEKAVSIYPKFLEAQLLLGTGYMDAKQWDKAEATLRRALEINPKATTASVALGDVLRREKKYDEAERVLSDALKLDDKSARAHFTLGEVYWEKNDLPRAGVQVGTALQLQPGFADAHLLAGNILLRARKGEEALAEFEEYLRLEPKGEFAEQARGLAQKIRQALAEKKK